MIKTRRLTQRAHRRSPINNYLRPRKSPRPIAGEPAAGARKVVIKHRACYPESRAPDNINDNGEGAGAGHLSSSDVGRRRMQAEKATLSS